MKLLYDIQTGTVLARYSQDTTVTPSEGNAIIDVPSTIPIPQAIVKVIVQDGSDNAASADEFIIDQTLVDNQWRTVKEARNQRLKDSDWTCSVTDYTPPNKADWITYRQALRDLTQQPNPFTIQWPASPGEPLRQSVVSAPVVTEPVSSDPASVPVVSEPVSSDSTNPVVTDPVSSDNANPIVSDPVVSDPSNPVVSEPIANAPTESAPTETPVVSEPAPSSS